MSGAWSQLEQLLTCAICLDRFRNPKLLPCQHTFCGEPCMEGLVDYARRQIKCPECRAEHRIPYNGVQSFPNNVTLARFLDLHRSITGDEPEPLPSQMDRCSVCGEKSYCNRCAHCEKKVCDECRTAHLDILRREINRINSQIRRGLEKLSEHAENADKGSEKLLQITAQIRDEITESVRRMVKDLKDKESKLLEELDEFTVSETKNTGKLKEDFETELATITSNCELAEEHITDADEWTDAELMEYKEIFLKTLDFLRNLDPDSMDYTRKIKYIQKVDLDHLRRSAADFGELKISQPASNFNSPLSPSDSSNNLSIPQSSLMRSQSDHRLAQTFGTSRSQRTDPLQRSYLDVTGQNRYGSDSERERGNSPPGRRGEGSVRFGSVHERTASSRFGRTSDNNEFGYTRGWPRPGDSDYEPSNSANFRSRFMRERIRERTGNAGDDHSFEEHDSSDVSPAHRVRFQEESPSKPKLFDTEEMANMRAPLSGLVKLIDSPHVMERLHQNEIKAKQKEAEAKENEANVASAQLSVAPIQTTQSIHRPQRQISEDEIEKQKKQNQAAFSQSQSATTTTTTTTTVPTTTTNPQPQPKTATTTTTKNNSYGNDNNNSSSNSFLTSPPATVTNRRIQAIQKEEKRSPSSSDDNSESEITCDEDLTTTTTPSSNPSSTTTRRRIYASTHSSSGGAGSSNPIGNLTNSFSQSADYGESSSRNNRYSSQQPSSTSTGGNNSYQSQYGQQSSYFTNNNQTLNLQSPTTIRTSSISRFGTSDESVNNNNNATSLSAYGTSYNPYKVVRKSSRDELERNITREETTTTPYYSQFGRRNSVNRRNHDHHFNDDLTSSLISEQDNYNSSFGTSGTSQHGRKTSIQPSNDRYGSSSFFKNRLAKSKSSHAVAYDDSDEESIGTNSTNNPLSPTASSTFKSRFAISSNNNNNSTSNSNLDNTENRYTSGRRTSRSGYTYRTREPSPEEESAGSVTQYLINKYGTRSNRPTALSKSKSSHVIFGRSLSSSDEDTPTNPPAKYRRDSNTDYSYKSSPLGLTYPRQLYMQKKRVMMKIGSRGTNPSCFTWPRGVACAPDNGIVVADSSNHRIQVFDSTGRFQFEFGSYGSNEGEFDCLAGVTVNRIGHFIVSDRYNHRVQVFDPSGRFLRAFGSEGRSDGKFSYPWGIATDALGFIYVCDKENHRIQVFQSDGTFVGKFGTIGSRAGMLEHPHYIAVSNMNRIIVSDSNNHRIQIFDINGRSISTFGSEGSGDGQFKFPRGVAVDENGFVIVGDSGNNRIQIFNPDGTFLKTFGQWGSGEGEFKGLEGVAISSTGNILVCDRENHRIQVF